MIENVSVSIKRELQASLELKLNHVGNMLKRAAYRDVVRIAETGSVFEFFSFKTPDNQDMMLAVNFLLDPLFGTGQRLYLDFSGYSLGNVEYFRYVNLVAEPVNNYRRTVNLLSRNIHLEKFASLQTEDAMIFKITISSSPDPSPKDAPVKDHIYRTILNEQSSEPMRFTAFSHRTPSGRLTRGRSYVPSAGVIESRVNLSSFDSVDIKIVTGALSQAVTDARASYTDQDSDFEEDAEPEEEDRKSKKPRKSQSLESKDGNEESTFVVQMVSSHVWEAFLFYLYCGELVFAPLKSEGAARDEFIKQFTEKNLDAPRPCSCKSMYRLAFKAGIPHLQNRCLEHLESRLTVNNILVEVFSPFTSQYKEVEDMEMGVLSDLWEQLKKQQGFTEKLRQIYDNGSDHTKSLLWGLLGDAQLINKRRRLA
ncbi:hypothetical protein OBBRIDRAFT_791165 [Obba rivulosa]|uniref:Uncharacterized protein n=1 Tax=Obba rivulosa TaxID=1052685 RepID=A0A8E2AWW8_9APHY|nr:hypothetical protein OBBRIDRAFT_791165 [Obba rivulosa]